MKIALIGYGKMGKEIEKIAISRGHEIVLKFDVINPENMSIDRLKKAEVAIEFTTPDSAVDNYKLCFEAGVPVVSGTTGWLHRKAEVEDFCMKCNAAFFYASNFSIGVNLFFALNQKLASMMDQRPEYMTGITEIHHIHKLDAPSGTAITLAEGILANNRSKTSWVNTSTDRLNEIRIVSEREGEVPGTHIVKYDSEVDTIEITHIVKNRRGLALGAVMAAEFLKGKHGIFGMNDLIKF
jgi:4-hydroxy-tetrahydrodipicolinate reductase